MNYHHVFVTGSTGYIGRRLIARLLERGHRVRALARRGSEQRLPPGCEIVIGDALDGTTFRDHIAPADTLVHLVGVAHPSPAKAELFRMIDLASVRESTEASRRSGLGHFVYVSVAQPAPVMRAYQVARSEGEGHVRSLGIAATILRPWYVLGPGHRWPYLLLPLYWILEALPATRDSAHRLGLVTLDQMLAALVDAVETPPAGGPRTVEVPQIRHSTSRPRRQHG